jgi:hypothetical protein
MESTLEGKLTVREIVERETLEVRLAVRSSAARPTLQVARTALVFRGGISRFKGSSFGCVIAFRWIHPGGLRNAACS